MNISNLITALLPDQNKTDFLKLCLNEFSFQQYQKLNNTDLLKRIKNKRNGFKRLLPLLYFNLKKNGIEIGDNYGTYLKTAYVREELRSSTFKNILSRTIQLLLKEKCEFILLNGASLAEPIYENWNIRHCHDIDILVKDNSMEVITSILTNNNFKKEIDFQEKEIRRIILKDNSGLSITLYNKLFSHSFYNKNINVFWDRFSIKKIADLNIFTLSDSDALFHILGKAFTNYFFSLQWVADAVFLIRKANIDWDLFYKSTVSSGLSISILPMIRYLKQEFNVDIPYSLFKNLEKAAGDAKSLEKEAALFNATNGMRSGFLRLIRSAKNWKDKLSILRFGLFPSKILLEWNGNSAYKINLNHLKESYHFLKMINTEEYLKFSDEKILLLKSALLNGEEFINIWNNHLYNFNLEKTDPVCIKIFPLLYVNLKKHKIETHLLAELKKVYNLTWYKNKLLFNKMFMAIEALDVAGIESIPLKGMALSLAFYKDFGLRPMNDFDLLVPKEKIRKSVEVLFNLGYNPRIILILVRDIFK